MASLQVRHSRNCPVCPGRQEATAAADKRACGCRIVYTVDSIVNGEKVREKVGTDREEAEKRLARIGFALEENDYKPPQHIRFTPFADEWLESLRRRSTTHSNYAVTLEYAKAAFGRKYVSKLGPADVRKMLELVEREYRDRQKPKKGEAPRDVSPTTLAKHLRTARSVPRVGSRRGAPEREPVQAAPEDAAAEATQEEPRLLHRRGACSPVAGARLKEGVPRPLQARDNDRATAWRARRPHLGRRRARRRGAAHSPAIHGRAARRRDQGQRAARYRPRPGC